MPQSSATGWLLLTLALGFLSACCFVLVSSFSSPLQCYFTVAADFESPLAERHYRDVIYSGSSKPREKIRILTAEETRALIKVFQAKSKMRKALGAVNQPSAPLSHVTPSAAASAAPAAASASAASASSASSSFVAAAQHSSANTSRRNSVDSTASGDDDGKKKGSSSVAAVAAKKNPKANQTCKRWLADECTFTDETCKFMHVATVCRAFQRGTCPKGERCPFVHDKVDREVSSTPRATHLTRERRVRGARACERLY